MNIDDIKVGNKYYLINKSKNKVITAIAIEINKRHSTVLMHGVNPFASGNFGAHSKELYKSKSKAQRKLKKEG